MMLSEQIVLPQSVNPKGTGWLPPRPDLRDYTPQHKAIKPLGKKLGLGQSKKAMTAAMPASVDLREFCSPIEDQGQLGSCTANAAVGMVEYFQRRAYDKHIDGSRLFVYKATRNLMGVTGDTGAWLRDTMAALTLCGVPPTRYWPYTDADPDFDVEPDSFVYSVADNYQALQYFCHDPQGQPVDGADVLESVQQYLAAGIPSMFGFWGFDSFDDTAEAGAIPFPCDGESAAWGHAIVAVGYDDAKEVTNTRCNATTTGALLIRNSWSTAWGAAGYGWLPYAYVERKLAMDFWSLISIDWVDTNEFGL